MMKTKGPFLTLLAALACTATQASADILPDNYDQWSPEKKQEYIRKRAEWRQKLFETLKQREQAGSGQQAQNQQGGQAQAGQSVKPPQAADEIKAADGNGKGKKAKKTVAAPKAAVKSSLDLRSDLMAGGALLSLIAVAGGLVVCRRF